MGLLLVSGCAQSSPPGAGRSSTTAPPRLVSLDVRDVDEARVRHARQRAIAQVLAEVDRPAYTAGAPWTELGGSPQFVLIGFYFLYARFDLRAFRDFRERALEARDRSTLEQRVQYRHIDPTSRPSLAEVRQVTDPVLRPIADAFACDVRGAPKPDVPAMQRGLEEGGYVMTHVAIALEVRSQLGCRFAGLEELERLAADRLHAAVDGDDQRVAILRTGTGVDLLYEQMAFLGTLEGPEAITRSMVRDVLATQRSDGGWGDLHTTQLALTVLSLWLGEDNGKVVIH